MALLHGFGREGAGGREASGLGEDVGCERVAGDRK
jgi:hypothetical protein